MRTFIGLILLLSMMGCSSTGKKALIYFEDGNKQLEKGNVINSILWYDKAIALDPGMVEAYMKRAEAKLSLTDYQGATADYSKVIELDPKRTEAYLNRGVIKIYKKEFTDEAVSDFDKVIELNPNLADAWYNRGVVFYVQKKKEAACNDWKHSFELGSTKAPQKIKMYCK